MKYKMKGSTFYGKSPLKKKYDFSKKKDYSAEATKGSIGDKIAKAVTPKSLIDVIPVSKAVKGAKALYNYMKA
tara:strand:- start:294 stop:512 length:219 start_codon:yes stop_codon:yes gene_type:complete